MHKENTIIPIANSKNTLQEALSAIDITVPSRVKGRTKDHKELYCICRLLATLSNSNLLSYPLSLTKPDRPDFLLNNNDLKIGIEVTESIPQHYAQYLDLAEKESSAGVLIEPAHFSENTQITKGEMQTLLKQDRLTSDGWVGDQPEKEWSLSIQKSINSKIKKLNDLGFSKFEKNWLLIYDNTPSLFLEKNLLTPYLAKLYTDSHQLNFDKIFIETAWSDDINEDIESIIIMITSEGFEYFPLMNLWNN